MIEDVLAGIIKRNAAEGAWNWINEKTALINKDTNALQLNITFTAIPRKMGKKTIELSDAQQKEIEASTVGFSIAGWTLDRLSRVWLLMKLNNDPKDDYIRKVEALFNVAEMNELVALYSSLPFLAYPESWKFRCTEGIRSNIGTVLESIMYENPYPAKYLDEPAWNQMVLKAFFTDKNVDRIIGLDERANKELAAILIDYAHERWAAYRRVNPQLWRLIGKFIDENNFGDIEKLFHEGNVPEKKAAALACADAHYSSAKQLLNGVPNLELAIKQKTLTWHSLAKEVSNFSSN